MDDFEIVTASDIFADDLGETETMQLVYSDELEALTDLSGGFVFMSFALGCVIGVLLISLFHR